MTANRQRANIEALAPDKEKFTNVIINSA